MPVKHLLVQALRRFHEYYGTELKPTGSGQLLDLGAVADEITRRLIRIFQRGTTCGAWSADLWEYNHSLPPALFNLIDHFLEENSGYGQTAAFEAPS